MQGNGSDVGEEILGISTEDLGIKPPASLESMAKSTRSQGHNQEKSRWRGTKKILVTPREAHQ